MNNFNNLNYVIEEILQDRLDIIYDEGKLKKMLGHNYLDILDYYFYKYHENLLTNDLSNYQDILKVYDLFLEKTNAFISLINSSFNDLEKAFVFEYMLYYGYLSFNKKFSVKNIHTDIPFYLNSLVIILGNGVCRHIASFYADLFKDYPYITKFTGIHQKGINNSYNKHANHVINIVNYHNIFYGIDFTNHDMLNFINSCKLQSITHPEYFITYKTKLDLFLTNESIYDIKSKLLSYSESASLHKITIDEYQMIKMDIYKYMQKRKDLLEDYHQDTKEMKLEIKEKILTRT